MSFPSPTWTQHAGRVVRLARKELSESLRDRRTILTLVLMPLLLYPLLALAFQQLVLSSSVEKAGPVYRLGFASEDEAHAILDYWGKGREALVRRHNRPNSTETNLPPDLNPMPELRSFTSPDLSEELEAGRIDVSVRLSPPGAFDPDPLKLLFVDCELTYRDDSAVGKEAVQHLEILTASGNARQMTTGLRLIGVRQRGDPVRVRVKAVSDPSARKSTLFPVLVPLVLILMTITGAVYPAIDLTAGERERGTLEVLVAAPIPRLSVLFAKYVAVWTVATLTALVNLTAMTVTLYALPSGIGTVLFGATLTPLVLVEVLGLLLLFAAFFSAVLLAITSCARSFKEAQVYLIPLMLLALAPGVIGLMPGLSLHGPLAVVPLLNVVLLARDIFEGTASWASAAVVVPVTLLYAAAAIGVAARVFGTEAVLSEQSGWGDFLRRPSRPRRAATPSGALLCLAVLFPAYFLLMGRLAQVSGLTLSTRLLVLLAANVLLFAGLPLFAAWAGRVEVVPGFRLCAPGMGGVACALLLGVGLWPFVHELTLFLRQVGFATLRPEVLEKVREALAEWRQLPLPVLLALAVVPAVLEELFFRGYLFTAFERAGVRMWPVVLGTAGLFALFHLLVGESLAVERLPPSFLLGVVLGVLAWKTGSVWPGMLLHVLHNGILTLLGYYAPWLEAAGWVPAGEEHMPGWLLAGAGVAAALGLAALGLLRRKGASGEGGAAGLEG